MSTISSQDYAAKLAELEAELARLTDLESIYRLRLAYYDHVNESRFGELPALFAPDATVDFGNDLGRHTGRAAIAAALATLPADAFIKLAQHGHVADLDGDRADGHLYTEGRLIVNGESFITMAKVTDRYVRHDGVWRIAQTETEYYYAVPHDVGWVVEDKVRPFAAP